MTTKKKVSSPINFQITLSTYKLYFQNKNYIYKILKKILFFFFSKKIGPLKKKKVIGKNTTLTLTKILPKK